MIKNFYYNNFNYEDETQQQQYKKTIRKSEHTKEKGYIMTMNKSNRYINKWLREEILIWNWLFNKIKKKSWLFYCESYFSEFKLSFFACLLDSPPCVRTQI